MAAETIDIGANVPSQDLNGPKVAGSINFMEKYGEERDKRMKAEGLRQYIDLRRSEQYKKFIEDPWIDANTPVNYPVPDGGRCRIMIAGGGFGGLLFAVKLIKAGFSADDLLIVDPAGGFGGTWYWNRYPGLMCDVESYIYLPLLEEMGYMPKRRYSFGFEIRKYLESIASKYGLHRRAMFQSACKKVEWNETKKEWVAKISSQPKGGQESEHTVIANFVIFASGVLNNPKLPDLQGIDSFNGHMFHTSRWDYSYTGGSPEEPILTGLRGKRVGFIGTGATAVQSVPEMAKTAEQLYIFQRTPSSVDQRDNHDTDPAWFKNEVAAKEGWQRERNLNFVEFVENNDPKPKVNLVNDGWSRMGSYSGLIGTTKPVTMENVVEHIGSLNAIDYPRQERIRQRAADIVKDQDTAKKLQAWYPSWCKRPCFHDEYLQAFNSPNVILVDTDGKGIDRITEKGIEFGGKEYEVDVIIWGTGFRSPFIGSAAGKAEVDVRGKGGIELEAYNDAGKLETLHGVISNGFPNAFWPAISQGAATANFTFVLDNTSSHVAHIIAEATKMSHGKNPVIEPTLDAQEEWAMQIMMNAATFGAMATCTPSYLNKEGEIASMTPEEQMASARKAIWGNGYASYVDTLEKWRAQGGLVGLEVTSAA